MKRVQVSIRSDERLRGVTRLRQRDTAIVFTTSDGKRYEVDLLESPTGSIILRSHDGTITVKPNAATLEVGV